MKTDLIRSYMPLTGSLPLIATLALDTSAGPVPMGADGFIDGAVRAPRSMG